MFIDKEGQEKITVQNSRSWHFSEGLALTKHYGKYGFINTEGVFVLSPQYDKAEDFHQGLSLVEKDGERYYIDFSGRRVFES